MYGKLACVRGPSQLVPETSAIAGTGQTIKLHSSAAWNVERHSRLSCDSWGLREDELRLKSLLTSAYRATEWNGRGSHQPSDDA